jgi:hypothetical protein
LYEYKLKDFEQYNLLNEQMILSADKTAPIDSMASVIEQSRAYGSPCHDLPKTIKRGLGPEFIYPFIVLFFATILRKLLRYYLNYSNHANLFLFVFKDIIISHFHIQLY